MDNGRKKAPNDKIERFDSILVEILMCIATSVISTLLLLNALGF